MPKKQHAFPSDCNRTPGIERNINEHGVTWSYRQIFEQKHTRFQSFYLVKLSQVPFFTLMCFIIKFKGTAPKVLWEKDKELKSDPRSCALVWAPC